MAGSIRITTRLDNLEKAFGRLKASQQDLQLQVSILNPKSTYLKEMNSDMLQAETRIAELTRRSNGLRDEMNDIIEKNTISYEQMTSRYHSLTRIPEGSRQQQATAGNGRRRQTDEGGVAA